MISPSDLHHKGHFSFLYQSVVFLTKVSGKNAFTKTNIAQEPLSQ